MSATKTVGFVLLSLSAVISFVRPFALAQATTRSAQKPVSLPVYDHIVIVMDENKDYDQIVGTDAAKNAPYIFGVLKKEGASLTRMYGEEHHSEGNYFWLFSGARPPHLDFNDSIPQQALRTKNLGAALIAAKRSFKGYSEDLPKIGSTVHRSKKYARKHVPWVSFSNVPNGETAGNSSNLRFSDFPADFNSLPTVAIVIPNLDHDMHDGSVRQGNDWLCENLSKYYIWAKDHNSLFILTFDEDDHAELLHGGLTNPAAKNPQKANRIPTIFAGAHIKPGSYDEGKGVTHVNLLRTIEAMYKLSKSGAQQQYAAQAGIDDAYVITDIFDSP